MRRACRMPLAVPVLFIALALMASRAAAEDLIFTLSSDRIRITSDFRGVDLVAFGAIERDAETVSRGAGYDVVVVMRGPPETLVTRRKARFAGIWINRASRTFPNVPSFYLASASRPLADISTPAILKRYQIGPENLAFQALGGPDEDSAFRDGLIRLKADAGLFEVAESTVSFPGTSVFKANLSIPANVPVGDYVVTAYLFRDSAMLARQSLTIRVSKEGFERLTFDLAHRYGYLYGLLCVVLALFTGWLAGIIFRRD
ncbi:uncharacterized protein (TIGR02186 family) [Kaistia hirudinis]|uniref:Uncharacterized protein (TIGR02186 family) n=1 Tax=Kaistia hirudinis TaxID=1293440 RepID=A0A840ASU5_9HYPH|nr:TIGR02186 family protein [Kaistia hirudinis]MBB3933470.1 uncharacterized protein (TIGR02186 family) [Kaistia hirudinis]